MDVRDNVSKNAAGRRRRTRGILLALVAVAGLCTLSACQSLQDLKLPWKLGGQDTESGGRPNADSRLAVDKQVCTTDSSVLRRAQSLLAKLGYRPGFADGVCGPKTTSAVRKYQSDRRLKVDGAVTEFLLSHLEATLRDRSALRRAKTRRKDKEQTATPATTKSVKLLPLKRTNLPTYETGASFIYSGGRVDRVTGIRGDTIRWMRNNGTTYTAYRNFLVPWSSWKSKIDRGTVSLSREADTIWPLAKGDEARYSATVMVQMAGKPRSPIKKIESWICRNAGLVAIKTLAGTFDTVKFLCDRKAGDSVHPIVRSWYYAPSIRHHVRVEDETTGSNSTRINSDLLAIQPTAPTWPPIARAALERAVLQALKTTPDGAVIPWTSSGVRTRVTIEMGSRFTRSDGKQCRPFVQVWTKGRRKSRYPAVACRGASGRWGIPGLGQKSQPTLAIASQP